MDALGIDISPEAVRQTRRRGAAAVCRDIFTDVGEELRWQHILLADGNINGGPQVCRGSAKGLPQLSRVPPLRRNS